MLNMKEMLDEAEENYLSLEDNETKTVTFVSDDKLVPKTNKKNGSAFTMRQYKVRLENNEVKDFSLFPRENKKLLLAVAKFKGIEDPLKLTSIVDTKVTIIKTTINNVIKMDFKVLA